MSRFPLKKSERLCSKKDIAKLFSAGKSRTEYPFRVTLLIIEGEKDPGAKVIFGVSRKLYKRAVQRNLIKRRIREAFRLQKNALNEKLTRENKTMLLMLNYIGREVLPYQIFEKRIGIIIARLMK
ncbi:MAG TPA: ribonuclease P protein component [Bacteroidales bacterium]|nr:ribonuclease P protein component [Bacteroidales bacterium]